MAFPRLDALTYQRAQCLGHLIRRCADLLPIPGAPAKWYLIAVMRALQAAIALRALREDLAASTYRRHCRAIERELDLLLGGGALGIPDHERLRRHMLKHRD